jgi:hypothetical protein
MATLSTKVQMLKDAGLLKETFNQTAAEEWVQCLSTNEIEQLIGLLNRPVCYALQLNIIVPPDIGERKARTSPTPPTKKQAKKPAKKGTAKKSKSKKATSKKRPPR